MGNPHDEDDHNIILDLRNQAIVVHAITSLTAAIRGQPFAVQARVAAFFKIFPNPRIDAAYDKWIQFPQLTNGLRCILNLIGLHRRYPAF